MRLRGLLLVGSILILAAAAPVAQAEDRFGIVVHGGVLQPVDQEFNDESGTAFGLRFPINTGTIFGIEPFIYTGGSDDTVVGPTTYGGIDLTSWGANVSVGRLVRPGMRVYPFVGIGNNTLHNDAGEISKIGWNLGLGVGISPGNLMIDLRGERNFVDVGEETTEWNVFSLGLGYRVDPGF